ncbi:MarR family transcriptional regulator [Embleya scabrispora]|uniref:MarR family transcriptional regulator n=1 Tax=Embleya scabrispora TaxID=159449 RepID=A0A1T3P482_9ACTN|nr:MarR family winged helix-turn-helix transcriptional regulator [Embleya scabrispora]OPC83752.1 MarR family transcriptional regulator [Embleya scabrispora]
MAASGVGGADVDRAAAEPPGFELPLRLLMAFRALIDEVHAELARQGHPDMRPMHGFVFQAIGPHGTTAADLGRLLGVSKQAAGKTIDGLEQLGYVERHTDPNDARRKLVGLTAHGVDSLVKSAAIFEDVRAKWADRLGVDRLRALEEGLRVMTPGDTIHLDMPAWFGGG